MAMKWDNCRTCGAKIVWIKTLAGKPMPCDAEGVLVVEESEAREKYVLADGRVASARKAVPEDRNDSTRTIGYVSHFATCPQAAQHRKVYS